jgi:hypothetical protein
VSPETSVGTFNVPFTPDGTLRDDQKGISESFNLVSGLWMTPSSGTYPTLTGQTASYGAKYVKPTTGDPVVAGVPGVDVVGGVRLDFTVAGTAPWYGNEVVYLATAGSSPTGNGHASPWAASTWPKSTACGRCRAAQVAATTRPSQTYSFTFNLHVPAAQPAGTYQEFFRPVADVPVPGGGVAPLYFGPAVPVTIVVARVPVGEHQLTATAMTGSEPTEGYDTTDVTAAQPYGHWYACTAAATADAVSTGVDDCTIVVSHADGTTSAYQALSSADTAGGLAIVTGHSVTWDADSGDSAQVCWRAHATYADGTRQATSGCTSS